MIIVDSSALLAILLREAEADRFKTILAVEDCCLPIPCHLEVAITLRRRGYAPETLVRFEEAAGLELLPTDARQVHLAVEADRRYGRGTGHPAGLNFGDCLVYAAAIAHDAPLLFKGDDFVHTDVRRLD